MLQQLDGLTQLEVLFRETAGAPTEAIERLQYGSAGNEKFDCKTKREVFERI